MTYFSLDSCPEDQKTSDSAMNEQQPDVNTYTLEKKVMLKCEGY